MISHCGSNARCNACPIARLENAEDRVAASEIVRLASQDLQANSSAPLEISSLNLLRVVAEEKADLLHKPQLAPVAVGAFAIGATSLCKIESGSEF